MSNAATPATPPSDELVQDSLRQLLAEHGLAGTDYNGWLLPNNQPPGLQAVWTPSSRHPELMGTLAVTIRMLDRREITESFAGLGPGDAALRDALASFAHGSLPVLKAAIWNLPSAEQAEPATWNVGGHLYDAFIGPWQLRNQASLPAGIDTLVRAKIENEPLTQDLHWFRLFISQAGGRLGLESLQDNALWENGQAVAELKWQERQDFYSARQFLVLRRVKD